MSRSKRFSGNLIVQPEAIENASEQGGFGVLSCVHGYIALVGETRPLHVLTPVSVSGLGDPVHRARPALGVLPRRCQTRAQQIAPDAPWNALGRARKAGAPQKAVRLPFAPIGAS